MKLSVYRLYREFAIPQFARSISCHEILQRSNSLFVGFRQGKERKLQTF